jgi:hypothetical protein
MALVGLADCGGEVTSGLNATSDAGALAGNAAMVCYGADGTEEPVVRKSFLAYQVSPMVPHGRADLWSMQARIVAATPHLSALEGTAWTGMGRFVINPNRLEFANLRSDPPLDTWSATNVDTNGGCALNEDQLWQVRGWVSIDLEKSNASDLAVFGSALPECLMSSSNVRTALLPGSFVVDETAGTMTWSESITASVVCPTIVATEVSLTVEYSFAHD